MPSFELKDSGERQEFESGARRDTAKGKGRYDLISPVMLRRLAIVMEKGAAKYSARNWEKGIPLSRFLDSALRHTCQLLEGKEDEDHAAQAIFNLMGFIHTKQLVMWEALPLALDDVSRRPEKILAQKLTNQPPDDTMQHEAPCKFWTHNRDRVISGIRKLVDLDTPCTDSLCELPLCCGRSTDAKTTTPEVSDTTQLPGA